LGGRLAGGEYGALLQEAVLLDFGEELHQLREVGFDLGCVCNVVAMIASPGEQGANQGDGGSV
jgi:hypothetical protein